MGKHGENMDVVGGCLKKLRWLFLFAQLRTRLISFLIVLLHLMCLGGCSSVTGPVSYPISWAPIDTRETKDGCPNIEGVYSNQGTEAFPLSLAIHRD